MNSYKDYTIIQGDTLESIALRQLGSANFWRQIAAVNKLRSPYLSDNPIDQYAQAIVTGTSVAITAGATGYTVALPAYASTFSAGTYFYIQQNTATGLLYDGLKLSANVNESTGVLAFSTAFVNTYPAGLTYYLFPNPNEIGTAVLRTGDVLHIPTDSSSNQAANTGPSRFVDQLGTDLWLDNDGYIAFDQYGDVVTTTSTSNLKQALAARLRTPYGSLPHHPTYGNRLFFYVGQSTSDFFQNLAQGVAKATVLADPRVNVVSKVQTTTVNTVVTIDMELLVQRSSGVVRLDNLVLSL